MRGGNRYNFALLPPASAYSFYQSYAREIFGSYNCPYLLGPKSFPHITLCQFLCSEPDRVQAVYEAVMNLRLPLYNPEFLGLSITSESPSPSELFWIGLMVVREASLVNMHQSIKDILENAGLSCLSQHGEKYRPHLTMASAFLQFPFTLSKWPEGLVGQSPYSFSITLGLSDDWGQFIASR